MQMRLSGVAFILAGIIMFIITFVRWLKVRSFKDCQVTSATVTDTATRTHYTNGRSSTSYALKLAYDIDGNHYERELPCDHDEYAMGANRQIEIRYKSNNPKKILSNDGERHARGLRILWIITGALLAIGAVMLLLAR